MSAVECTHCLVTMTESPGSQGRIRYFCCPRCGRWATTSYAEVLRTHAGARERHAAPPPTSSFEQIKARMDRWIAQLDANDPHQALGVSPRASADEVRSRYRQLALQHHPDRGGDPKRMQRVNEAYQRLRMVHR